MSEGYGDFLERRAELGAALDELAGLYRELGVVSRADTLDETRARLHCDSFRLMVIGEFKRGKSTLINALLGQPVLPAKVAPCTGVVTVLRYGEEPGAVLYPRVGEPREVPIEALRSAVVIDDDGEARHSEYARAEVTYPLPLLRNNVEILDSPGLNEHEVRTEVALEYLPRADALIWVLSAEMALSQSELEFLDTLAKERPLEHVFFLWNRYDAVADSPKEREALRRRSEELLEPRLAVRDRIFCVSARDALVARRADDAERLERSGLPAFERALEQFLAVERGRVKLAGPLRTAEIAARALAIENLPRAELLLREPVAALRHRYESSRPALEMAERQKGRVMHAIERRRDAIVRELERAVYEFAAALEKRVVIEAGRVELSWFDTALSRARAREKVIQWMEGWLRGELDKLESERLRPILTEQMQGLELELEEELRALIAAVEGLRARLTPDVTVAWLHPGEAEVPPIERVLGAVGGLLFGGPGPAVEGASFGARSLLRGLPIYLTAAIAFGLMGVSSGFILAGLFGVGVVRTVLTGQDAATRLRAQVGRDLAEGFRAQVPNLLDEVRQRVREPFAQLLVEVGTACSRLIAEAQQQVEQALRDRESGEQALAEGLTRLAETRARLARLSERLDRVRVSAGA